MEPLPSSLSTLRESGLIRPTAGPGRREYAIRHSLLRDTAYRSMLRSERKAIHLVVGDVLRRHFPEREIAPVLAQHYETAEQSKLAFKYHLMAADASYDQYANFEAVDHYERAFQHMNPKEMDRDELIRVHRYYGRAMELVGEFDRAIVVLESLTELADVRGDSGMKMIAMIGQARLMATITPIHDPETARPLAEGALRLAREQGHLAGEVRALWVLLLCELYSDVNFDKAERRGLEALEKARQLGEDRPLALVITDLARLYMTRGEPQRALNIVDEAYELWKRDGNLVMLVDISTLIGSVSLIAGHLERSRQAIEEALEISLEIENPWGAAVAMGNASMTDHMQGRTGDALSRLDRAERMGEEADVRAARQLAVFYRSWIFPHLGAVEDGIRFCRSVVDGEGDLASGHRALILGNWARLEIQRGELEKAEELLGRARALQRRSENIGWLFNPLPLAEIEWASAAGEHRQALEKSRELIADMESRGSRVFLPQLLCHAASALIGLSREEEALQALDRARDLAESMNLRRDVWRILVETARAEERLGRSEGAVRTRRWARTEIEDLLSQIGDPALRQSFQERPLVAETLRVDHGNSRPDSG